MIYLDNSATTFPKPESMYDFMIEFYSKQGVSPGRSGFDAALLAEELVQKTRKLMTELLQGGNDHNRLTFSYNASDSLNLVIQGLAEPNAHVITTMLEHNSVLRPLYCLNEEGKLQDITYLPFDYDGYVNPNDFHKAIQPNTKFVVCTHCSNVLGTTQPLHEIGKICKEHGILFVVDGSQGAGATPVDMQADNIDVYIFTGHKSLMGPTGIGGAYIREGINIKHTRYAGTGVRSAYPKHLEEYPYRLEYGTLNLVGVAGLYAGVSWVLEQGIENIHHREMALWEKLREGIQKVKGITTYCANFAENRNSVLSFNINGFEAADVGTMLDVDYEIACRTGLQCAPKVHEHIGTLPLHGTVRLSIGPFNTEADVDAVIQAVTEIAALKN
jgi:cysteine desulfurase family protein